MGCARKAQCTLGMTRVRRAASGSIVRTARSRSMRAFLRPVSKEAQRQRAVFERDGSGAEDVLLPSSASSHADPNKESDETASSSHADEDDGDRRGGGEEELMELEEEEEELVEVVVVVVVGTQQ